MIYSTTQCSALICSVLCVFTYSVSIAQSDLHLGVGYTFPQNELVQPQIDIREMNTFYGGFNYVPDKFGVGLTFNIHKYTTNQSFIENFNGFETNTSFSENSWRNSFVLISPIYRLQKQKFRIDFKPAIGLGIVRSPDRVITVETNSGQRTLYADNAAESGLEDQSIFAGINLDLSYVITEKLSLKLFGGYITSRPFGVGNSTIYREVTADQLNENNLSSTPLQQLDCNCFDLVSVGLGLGLKFGTKNTKKPKKSSDENKPELPILPTLLEYPAEGSTFTIDIDSSLFFSWKAYDQSAKSFTLEINKRENVIFTTKSNGQSWVPSEKIVDIFKSSPSEYTEYQWRIITEHKDFGSTETAFNSFGIRTGNDAGFSLSEIKCADPAYDGLGNVCYTAKITMTNPPTSSSTWRINNLEIKDDGNITRATITPNDFKACNSSGPYIIWTPPILAIGQTRDACINFCVPIGTTVAKSVLSGTRSNGLPSVESDQDSLPPCVCTICNDWVIQNPLSSIGHSGNSTQGILPFNYVVQDQFQIHGSLPIKEVKAEVVYVKQDISDTLCYTCTRDEEHMGLIYFDSQMPRVTGGNQWMNSGIGERGVEFNNDDYNNQIIWQASDPVTGIDFSTNPILFLYRLNLPQPHTLECCHEKWEVCVRYTFIDIDCNACDYLSCRIFDSANSGSSGGISTGAGSSSSSGFPTTPINVGP